VREVARLVEVMATLRQSCPWDAQQTHRSLVQYLIEETAETVEAIESGDRDHLREELGDLLLQVVFHAEIAAESEPGFDLDDVAAEVADKLIARHPYVFATEDVPVDLDGSWEHRKAREKGRHSVLEGIPDQLSALARANKIISRARSRRVHLELPSEPVAEAELGSALLELVARAQANGIDPDQALRDAVRGLEARVRAAESVGTSGEDLGSPDLERRRAGDEANYR
jgi:XTP/dITP diphosphohydrolase